VIKGQTRLVQRDVVGKAASARCIVELHGRLPWLALVQTRGGRISRAIPLRDVIAAGGALKTGQMASTPGSASQSSNWPNADRQVPVRKHPKRTALERRRACVL